MVYIGTNYTFESGDKQVYGHQGEVTGPGTGDNRYTQVRVMFPGNKFNTPCTLAEVRRRLRAAAPAATPRLRPTHATLPTRRAPAAASAQLLQPLLQAQPGPRSSPCSAYSAGGRGGEVY